MAQTIQFHNLAVIFLYSLNEQNAVKNVEINRLMPMIVRGGNVFKGFAVKKRNILKWPLYIVPILLLGTAAYIGRGLYAPAVTIHELLQENKQLKQAITSLTTEDQIGYAKVLDQQFVEGRLQTTFKFVETARDDKLKKILEKEYTIEGDVVHFDALIVRFGDKMVMDNKGRALYIWRRVYGEKTPPEEGFPIEAEGTEPSRYTDLLSVLPIKQREMFWSNIWDLATNLDKLEQYDIKAVYGNAVYDKLIPGLIYVFKIGSTGQVFIELVPDM